MENKGPAPRGLPKKSARPNQRKQREEEEEEEMEEENEQDEYVDDAAADDDDDESVTISGELSGYSLKYRIPFCCAFSNKKTKPKLNDLDWRDAC